MMVAKVVLLLHPCGRIQMTFAPSMEPINQKPDHHPQRKSQPGNPWQRNHQIPTDQDGPCTDKFIGGHLEGPWSIGLLHPQYPNSNGYQYEGEKCAYIGQFGHGTNVHKSGQRTHQKAYHDGRISGRIEPLAYPVAVSYTHLRA